MKLTKSPCSDCGNGHVRPVVAARSFTIDGHRVRVPGLIALVCDRCGERSWPEGELARGRTVAAIKRSAAAAA